MEQSLSKAFPIVNLHVATNEMSVNSTQQKSSLGHLLNALTGKVPSLQKKEKERILQNAHNALLMAYKPYSGISLWEDRYQGNVFLTAYAADYVLTLKDAGLLVPPGILPQLFTTLERSINTSPSSLVELRGLAYASWVLARAGFVVSNQLELCESFIRSEGLTRGDIYDSLMAGAYKTLYMEEEAQKHLQKVTGNAPQNWNRFAVRYAMFDVLAQYGLHARVLAKHFPQELQASIGFLQESFLEGLNKSHATLGASMSALALTDIVRASAQEEQGKQESIEDKNHVIENIEVLCSLYQEAVIAGELGYESGQEKAEIYSKFYLLSAPLCTDFDVKIHEQKSAEKKPRYFVQLEEYGYDKNIPKVAQEEGIRVTHSYSLDSGMPFVNSITQGEVLRVDVDIQILDDYEIPVAVVSLLPGGFELVLDHEEDTKPSSYLSLMRDEDRVIALMDAQREAKRITYHIRAIAQGDFTLPSVHAEGLFDTSLQSNSLGGRVFVLAP